MLAHLCTPDLDNDPIANRLVRPLFGQYRTKWPEYPGVEFHISHGEWIRILRENGFVLDALHELLSRRGRADASLLLHDSG